MAGRMLRRPRSKAVRRADGKIEGFAAELVVGSFLVIAFVFFLLNCGIAALYKEKLGYITAEAAIYSAGYTGTDVIPATEKYIAGLCTQMGLPASLTAKVTEITLNGKKSMRCQVSGTFLLLQGSSLPMTVDLTDTSVAMIGTSPTSTMNVTIVGNGNTVTYNVPGARVIAGP